VGIIDSLTVTGPLANLFSDDSILQAVLRFEAALARAEAACNVIPQDAAKDIAQAAQAGNFSAEKIAKEARLSATLAVPVVNALRKLVHSKNPEAASFVHWGATSQDVCDTAMILLLKEAQPILEAGLLRIETSLRRLSDEHAHTVMLGRTLLQAAGPITFGLKAAAWLAAIHRGRTQINAAFNQALVLQFGGATGTLAALGNEGLKVSQKLAEELGLACPEAGWHTHRDRLATLLCACGVLTGSLGKMARDLALLMQTEVGEAAEGVKSGRGGSSTMPHKRNPVGCVEALASVSRVPALVSSFLSGMVQEHERGVGNWQAEWPIIADVIQATGAAAAAMAEVTEALTIDPARMRANIDATHGAVFAERAMFLLAPKIGHEKAQKVLETALAASRQQKRKLSEALAQTPEATEHLDAATLQSLEDPDQYLGMAEEFRKRLLDSVK
jgi:3-carboxy-cis,cis-muconate cycloisomerase